MLFFEKNFKRAFSAILSAASFEVLYDNFILFTIYFCISLIYRNQLNRYCFKRNIRYLKISGSLYFHNSFYCLLYIIWDSVYRFYIIRKFNINSNFVFVKTISLFLPFNVKLTLFSKLITVLNPDLSAALKKDPTSLISKLL